MNTLLTISAERTLTRTFSYLQGDSKSWIWPLTETKLELRHTKNKRLDCDTYEIALSWRVEQQGATKDRFVTNYGIDVYKQGGVQAFVEQPTVVDKTRETRRMTTYDYETLFSTLGVVYDLHAAERSDNARVLD